MKKDAYPSLLSFLSRLDRQKIHYRLSHVRDEAIMIEIPVPGERWEVEFMDDGSVQVEVFRSDGRILHEEALDEIFKRYSD